MIKRIVVSAVLVLALMVAVKDGRVLRETGLTGACSTAQRLADGTQLDACRPGRIDGSPDLSRQGCTAAGTSGTYKYWHCPASVVSAPNGR
jgi:hypothetical protein